MARRQISGFQRKDKSWTTLPGAEQFPTGDSIFFVSGSLAFGEAVTVMRMLGEYAIMPSAATVALDSVLITVGIGVFSTDTVTAGASAVEDPGARPDFPWLFWASHPLRFGGTSTDPNALASSVRHRFDIRSMRKMKPRQSLVMVGQYANVAGNPPITVSVAGTRVLIAD